MEKEKILNMTKNKIEFLNNQQIIALKRKDKLKLLEITSRIAELQELEIAIIKEFSQKNSKANKK